MQELDALAETIPTTGGVDHCLAFMGLAAAGLGSGARV